MTTQPLTFRYAADLLARYPTTFGGVLIARGLSNGLTPAAMLDAAIPKYRARG